MRDRKKWKKSKKLVKLPLGLIALLIVGIVTAAIIGMYMQATVTGTIEAKFSISEDGGSTWTDMEDYTISETPTIYPGNSVEYDFEIRCNDATGGIIYYGVFETDCIVVVEEDGVIDTDMIYTFTGADTITLTMIVSVGITQGAGSCEGSLHLLPDVP